MSNFKGTRNKKAISKMIDDKLKAKIETKDIEGDKMGVVLYHHAGNVIFHELSTLVQGVDNGQRIGNDVRPQKLDVKFVLRNTDSSALPSAGGSIPRMIRVAIVKSKCGAMNQGDFSYLNPAFPGDGYCTRFNLEQVIVKYDRVHQLGPMDTVTGLTEKTPYRPFASASISMNNLSKLEYDGPATPAIKGGCYLLLWAVDNSGTSTGDVGYCYSTRLTYKDA